MHGRLSIVVVAFLVSWAAMAANDEQKLLLFGGNSVPSWVKSGASVDMNFATSQYYGCSLTSCLSITRASSKTNLLPSSASGFAYTTFGNNILAITPGSGLLIEESRTNQLLNSTAPATQTTGSLGTGTYTLWVNGSGSATMSLGTGVGCGTGTATNGTPVNFTISVAGTCIVTVVGSLNFEQLELGAFGTSGIVTAGATATRAADSIQPTGSAFVLLTGSTASFFAQSLGMPAISSTGMFSWKNNRELATVHTDLVTVSQWNGAVELDATAGSSYSSASKTMAGWSSAGRSIVANNGTVATDTNVFAGNGNSFLGSSGSGNFINTYLARAALWNSRLPDATLKAMTK